MSKTGEIKRLTKLIRPHLGIITNIGEAHLENFKNVKGIADAKSEIIEKIKRGGTVILNRDDKFFNFLSRKAKLFNLKVISFGKHKESQILLKKNIEKNGNSKITANINNRSLNLELRDINIYNVLASLAVLNALKKLMSKKSNRYYEIYNHLREGEKNTTSQDTIKILNLLTKAIMQIHYL